MTGKTKAAMPGRLSLNALLKHRQITRLAAGGQTLSQRNPYAQINRVRLTYGHRNPLKELDYNESLESAGNKHEQYSGSPEHQHCLGSEVPTNNVESCEDNQPSLRGEPLHNALRVAQNNPSLRGAVHSITESNPCSAFRFRSGFLALLRFEFAPAGIQNPRREISTGVICFLSLYAGVNLFNKFVRKSYLFLR
ncbi:Uncharacterised protein [Klebsiella pneumoniae]|nr:Uncharacterised protein [Klebsiella pneumoniae]